MHFFIHSVTRKRTWIDSCGTQSAKEHTYTTRQEKPLLRKKESIKNLKVTEQALAIKAHYSSSRSSAQTSPLRYKLLSGRIKPTHLL